MNSFERKRMTKLLGQKLSVAKTDIDTSQLEKEISSPHLPTNFCTKLRAPKAKLFQDYNFISLTCNIANPTQQLLLPCFNDCRVFNQYPTFAENRVGVDNDFESDDEQVEHSRRKMVSNLLVAVERRRGMDSGR